MPHFGWFLPCRVRAGRRAAKHSVRGAGGFSNRRFERRFWSLLPPRAKVTCAGGAECPLSLLKEMGPPEGAIRAPQVRAVYVEGLLWHRR